MKEEGAFKNLLVKKWAKKQNSDNTIFMSISWLEKKHGRITSKHYVFVVPCEISKFVFVTPYYLRKEWGVLVQLRSSRFSGGDYCRID